MEVNEESSVARFYGDLDIETLGGAGFASQRTTTEDQTWNLSEYEGLELSIEKADSKKYTLILKDELLPKDPDTGREQSTVSYEYDFKVETEPTIQKNAMISIPWVALKPTYRGKPKDDAPKLDLKKIKRFSIMNRSFFGGQEGAFSISIKSISAVKIGKDDEAVIVDSPEASPFLDTETGELIDEKSTLMGQESITPRIRVPEPERHRQRLRMAFARTLFFSAIVMLAVHATITLQRGCHRQS